MTTTDAEREVFALNLVRALFPEKSAAWHTNYLDGQLPVEFVSPGMIWTASANCVIHRRPMRSVGGGFECDCGTRDVDETCMAGKNCRATRARPVVTEEAIADYVASYEVRDPDYTPTEHERGLIDDAIRGFVAMLEDTTAPDASAGVGVGRAVAWKYRHHPGAGWHLLDYCPRRRDGDAIIPLYASNPLPGSVGSDLVPINPPAEGGGR